MVNDAEHGSPKENTCVRVVMVDGRPHLCIFATKDINIGEELRYDYGIADLPWRKKVSILHKHLTVYLYEISFMQFIHEYVAYISI